MEEAHSLSLSLSLDIPTSGVGGSSMPRFVAFLSSLLRRVADANDNDVAPAPPRGRRATAFHGLSRPAISVESYLERIFQYANCSPCCYVVAYIYLDRFARRPLAAAIDSLSVHRLLITSVMVAAKFMDDVSYNNAYFAKVGGISTAEINYLERDFLFSLNFQLYVTPVTFHHYCVQLQSQMYAHFPPQSSAPLNKLLPSCLPFPDAAAAAADEIGTTKQQAQQQQQLAV